MGESSSNTTTASTQARAASRADRSDWVTTGRPSPLPANGIVGVDGNDEAVPEPAGRLQERDVAGMEQVEAAASHHDGPSSVPDPPGEILGPDPVGPGGLPGSVVRSQGAGPPSGNEPAGGRHGAGDRLAEEAPTQQEGGNGSHEAVSGPAWVATSDCLGRHCERRPVPGHEQGTAWAQSRGHGLDPPGLPGGSRGLGYGPQGYVRSTAPGPGR